MHQRHVLARRHQADRRKIRARIVADIGIERGIDGERAGRDQERVAVGPALCDLARRDGAAGAAAVLDHDRLAEHGTHLFRDHARDEIVAAARRIRDHKRDRPRRIVLRARRARERDAADDQQTNDPPHHGSGRAPPGTGASKALSIIATIV